MPANSVFDACEFWGGSAQGGTLIRGRNILGEDSESNSGVTGREVALAELRPVPTNTIAKLNISAELDGKLKVFGNAFWLMLIKEKEVFGAALRAGVLEKITYTDRYLVTPWVLMLLREVIATLVGIGSAVNSATLLHITTNQLNSNNSSDLTRINNNWKRSDVANSSNREEFLRVGLENMPDVGAWPGELKFDERPKASHKREMALHFASGDKWVIHLDQGFGYWGPHENMEFPFRQGAIKQVKSANSRRESVSVVAMDKSRPTVIYLVKE